MVKFGAHAFVWIGDWNTELGNQTIEAAAKTGFDFLEIPLLRPDDFDSASHGQALKDNGIEGKYSLALPKDIHMPFRPNEARDFLFRAMDKIQEAGGNYLAGCTPYALGVITGKPPTDEEINTIVETMKVVAEEAQKRDMTLGIEACNRYETYLYNTLEDTRKTILAIGAPNVKLHGDTYHMNIEERSNRDAIVATADVLDYMHMSESHRGLVGSGTVQWDDVWAGLADINFDGHLVLESFAAMNEDIAAATALWRKIPEPPEQLATEGLAFLKAGAQKHGLI